VDYSGCAAYLRKPREPAAVCQDKWLFSCRVAGPAVTAAHYFLAVDGGSPEVGN